MSPFGAVLLAAAVGSWMPVAGGAWSPTEVELARIRAGLPSFVRLQAAKQGKGLPEWSLYSFQYQGQLIDGRRIVFINAYCIEPPEYAEVQFLLVLDGGTCFFNVKFDPQQQVFIELNFHGDA